MLAVLLPVPLWARLVLVVGAFTLPWIGVIAANAGPIVQKKSTPQDIPITPGRTIDEEP